MKVKYSFLVKNNRLGDTKRHIKTLDIPSNIVNRYDVEAMGKLFWDTMRKHFISGDVVEILKVNFRNVEIDMRGTKAIY